MDEPPKTFSNGRKKGLEALTDDEHAWLMKAVGAGIVSKIEAAAKLKVSLPTIDRWLRRPLGYRALRGRGKKATPSGPPLTDMV